MIPWGTAQTNDEIDADEVLPSTSISTSFRLLIPLWHLGASASGIMNLSSLTTAGSIVLIAILSLLFNSTPTSALSRNDAGKIDWHVPRIGVPHISSASATKYLSPRFHRLIKPDQDVKDKAQTAIFVATESNAVGALNPRNGNLVWRQVLEDNDPVQAFYQASDVALSISGAGGANVRLYHGTTGFVIWETAQHKPIDGLLPESGAPGVDAAFLRYGEGGGDVITLANARTVRRLDGRFGREVWRWEPSAEDITTRKVVRVVTTSDKVHIVSLVRASQTYKISVHTLSHAGKLLAEREIKSNVARGPTDLTVLPWNQLPNHPPTASPGPWVTWLDADGSIQAAPLDPPSQKLAQPQVIRPKRSDSSFSSIVDVGLGDKGLLIAKRSDGMGEVLRLSVDAKFTSMWEFEEDAQDAIYHGTYDRSGHAYINRVFFSRGQQLLNFHVFWANANNGGEGQVTGLSFQYDHDLHGDVLAAPFEASPVSAFQLVTRAVLVTASGSIRMIQEDKHQWILEEGLTQTAAAIFVDLPEQKLTGLEGGADALDREGFLQRIFRHFIALQGLPEYLVTFAKRFATGSYGAIDQATAASSVASPNSTATTVAKIGKNPSKEIKPEETKPSSLAPRVASANITATLHTDPFGFRKIIVAATKRGKLYAIDSLKKDSYIWEKSLVGFGQGEGEPIPQFDIKLLSLVRPLSSDGRSPVVSIVVAITLEPGVVNTRVFELNPLSGEFVNGQEAGQSVFLGPAKDAFLLPIEDSDSNQQAIGIVDHANHVHLVPDTLSVAKAFEPIASSFFFSLRKVLGNKQQIEGFVAEGGVSLVHGASKVWQLQLPEGETIVNVLSQPKEHVASLGRVLGDRSTLYKYLNPHAQLVTTITPSSDQAHVYLVDGVTGSVLFETELSNVDHTQGVHASFAENWIVYTYSVRTPEEGLATRMVSVELYEQPGADQKWTWTGNFSSYAGDSSNPSSLVPLSFSQTFLFPHGVRALATTTTRFGISLKNLLVATDRETLFSIPRKVLDPRRPLGKPNKVEAEEYMLPYNPVIPAEPKWVVSHVFPLGKIDKVITGPALLESTSTLFAFGLDSFMSRVSPSGQFDILQGESCVAP